VLARCIGEGHVRTTAALSVESRAPQMRVSPGLTCASCTRSLKPAALDPLLAQTG
jgi:hypothetical protein